MNGKGKDSSSATGRSERDARSETGTEAAERRGKLSIIEDKVKKLVTADMEERFGDVGELVEEYPCALESGILRQGKLYVTNRFVCFYCSHFGQEKKVRIPYKQIVGVTKENTAKVFPNALSIQTKQTEYMFRSFLKRDECHSLISSVWKNFKEIERSGGHALADGAGAGGGGGRDSFAADHIKPVVVKTVYDTHFIQLLSVAITPSPEGQGQGKGKKGPGPGMAFDLAVRRGRSRLLNTVHGADLDTLRDLHAILVEANAVFGELNKFPPQAAAGLMGAARLTPAQVEERTAQLNQVCSTAIVAVVCGAR
jgi:hypothetical protein